jgi:hypothetical protein
VVILLGLAPLLPRLQRSPSSAPNKLCLENKTHLSFGHKTLHSHIRVFQALSGLSVHQLTNLFPELPMNFEIPAVFPLVLNALVHQAKAPPVAGAVNILPEGYRAVSGIVMLVAGI